MESEKISLTQWKNKNKDIVEQISENEVTVAIGGYILNLLTTSSINMIEIKTEYGDNKKIISYY